MRLLITSTALAASCNAFALPSWITRAVDPSVPALSLDHFVTPKFARPLTLDQALSGQNASVTTIKPQDLQAAKDQVPTLVIPINGTVHGALAQLATTVDDVLDHLTKRQSTCSNVRTRVEWDRASNDQRQGYINAIKCLMSSPPSGQFPVSKSRYDDLVGLHQTLTPNVHGNAKFLLWHRYYTWTFESLLRDECGLQGPLLWFDETRYAGNYAASSIFSSQWFGSINLGGNCVTDGVSIFCRGRCRIEC
jgi:tyrosinase